MLRVPLSVAECASCSICLDGFGHHVLACTRTGLIKRGALLPELAWVQICTEAGGSVKHRPKLNSLAFPGVAAEDGRELDIVVGRLPIFGGKTVLGDATLRSPLSAEGVPKHRAEDEAGSTFHGARLDKARTYPELNVQQPHFTFLVLACEVGGHLSEECHSLLKQLATCKATSHPIHVRASVKAMYKRRWYGILSCAIQRAVAWNIAGSGDLNFQALWPSPEFEELCCMCVDAPDVSRMPG